MTNPNPTIASLQAELEKVEHENDHLEHVVHEAQIAYDELKSSLAMRDLETEIKCISKLNTYFVNRANAEGEMLDLFFPDWCNDFRDQLRTQLEQLEGGND